MKADSVNVTFAIHMKPGDLYAGNVSSAAPARPVQPFATAHRITAITTYTAADGRKMLRVQAGQFTLTSIPAAAKVLLIREGEPVPDQVTRYLAQHGVPTRVPAGAASPDDMRAEAGRLTRLAGSLGVSEIDLDDYVHDLASRQASDISNSGLDGQAAYLAGQAGPAETERMIRPAAARDRTGRGDT